ncbi:MAG: hypothetical protein HQK55_08000, partial [Deltaproteobacteria bacterium]|nr:hypothetical protein [Deltaproteobacteria bacterium]
MPDMEVGIRKMHDPLAAISVVAQSEEKEKPTPEQELEKKYQQVMNWWRQARDAAADERRERMRDHEIFDGDQWREEDKQVLQERGQLALVFNRVKPAIDWITGTEKRTRVDYFVLPRTADDAKGAEVKTKLLRYLEDVNKEGFSRSDAFTDAVISGLGWMEIGLNDDPEGEPIKVSYEDWRHIWIDPVSTKPDLSDARFLFRSKWLDLDIAKMMFQGIAPKKIPAIEAASITAGMVSSDDLPWSDDLDLPFPFTHWPTTEYSGRPMVRIWECWYRQPELVKVLKGDRLGTLNGTYVDENSPVVKRLVELGVAEVITSMRLTIRLMLFCASSPLWEGTSPYNHKRIPLVPIWGFRKRKNNTPYGVVRNLRDPQDDLNKRRSKALHILATNKAMFEDNAIEDLDNFAEEMLRPDGLLKVNDITRVKLIRETDLAEEHIKLMEQDGQYIEMVSGVTDELMGRDTNAVSGRAINARQDQGHVVTARLFDNLRFFIQLVGEIKLSLTEQFYTDSKVIRITGDRNRVDFVSINQPAADGTIINDITASQADFVVDTSSWTATVRQSMFETLSDMTSKLPPQVSIQLLDLVVDL